MTERRILTTAAVKALKPRSERYEQRDHGAVGLHLIVQTSGFKSWCLRFRGRDNRPTKLVLGPLDLTGQEMSGSPVVGQPLTLGAARQLANELHRQRAFGSDIISDHKKQKQRADDTFAAAVHAYLEEHASKTRGLKRTAKTLGLTLDGKAIPHGLIDLWGDRPLADITANDVFDVIQHARLRGIPGLVAKADVSTARQRRLGAVLGGFFGWCHKHRRIQQNPASALPRVSAGPGRDRVLSGQEIRQFWQACDHVGGPFGDCFRLLLLTGARLLEVGAMEWTEIDGSTWTLPSRRSKNGKAHVVPLSALTLEILTRQPRNGPYVFSIDGSKALSGWSRAKRRLDTLIGDPPDWVLHDLRRSFATGASEIGVAPHIVEAVLNHQSGFRASVAGVYNKATYLPEKRVALQRWADHVGRVVGVAAEQDNVVPLRGVTDFFAKYRTTSSMEMLQ